MLAFIAAVDGCDTADPAWPDEAEIVPALGVLGIPFGTAMNEVEARLGPKTEGGEALGPHTGWQTARFGPRGASLFGVRFFFSEANNELLDFITIQAPFDGVTVEGVGIGSTLNEVRAAFGAPVGGRLSNASKATYCPGERKKLIVRLERGVVTEIYLGAHIYQAKIARPC